MWPNLQETADSVTFTEDILNGKLHFLCSVRFITLPSQSNTGGLCYKLEIFLESAHTYVVS